MAFCFDAYFSTAFALHGVVIYFLTPGVFTLNHRSVCCSYFSRGAVLPPVFMVALLRSRLHGFRRPQAICAAILVDRVHGICGVQVKSRFRHTYLMFSMADSASYYFLFYRLRFSSPFLFPSSWTYRLLPVHSPCLFAFSLWLNGVIFPACFSRRPKMVVLSFPDGICAVLACLLSYLRAPPHVSICINK
jgi:hypothetical protein